MTPQPIKVRADVEMTCFAYDGVERIREAMRAALGAGTEACPVSIKLVAAPRYVLTTQTLDKAQVGVWDGRGQAARVDGRGGRGCSWWGRLGVTWGGCRALAAPLLFGSPEPSAGEAQQRNAAPRLVLLLLCSAAAGHRGADRRGRGVQGEHRGR